jgi:putative ABC transport system substrate-binding protein
MRRRQFLVAAGLVPAYAMGQSSRLPRVALVGNFPIAQNSGPQPADPGVRAFLEGLRDVGLVDGRNVTVIRRSDGGDVDRAPAIMQELVKEKVDVIVTSGGPSVWAALRATDRIPIVGMVDDVLDMGVLDSLARPGHNLTGIGETDPLLHGKRLQMMKEAAPSISRVAVFCYRERPNDRGSWRRHLDAAGKAMNVEVLWMAVDVQADLEPAFAEVVAKKANGLYVTTTNINDLNSRSIAQFALKHRLPAFGFPEDGMLLGYWSDYDAVVRRAAAYVKKILDGARPGDLPFEQPSKFDLVINQKTAKALGLAIPRAMLLRADQVIE